MPSPPCVLAGSGEGGEHGYDLLAMEDTEGVTFVAVGLRMRQGGFMIAAPYGVMVLNCTRTSWDVSTLPVIRRGWGGWGLELKWSLPFWLKPL